jgi:hypothetical protein
MSPRLTVILICCVLLIQVAHAAEEGKDGWPCQSNDDCISECKDNKTKVTRLCQPIVDPHTSLTSSWECQSIEFPCDWLSGEVCIMGPEGPSCEDLGEPPEPEEKKSPIPPCMTKYYSNSTEWTGGKYDTVYYKESVQGSGNCMGADLRVDKYKKDTYVGYYRGAYEDTVWYEHHCVNPKGMDPTNDTWGYVETEYYDDHKGDYPSTRQGNYTRYFYNVCGDYHTLVIYACDIETQLDNDMPGANRAHRNFPIKCMDLSKNRSLEWWGCVQSNNTYTLPDGKKYNGAVCAITNTFEPEEPEGCELSQLRGIFQSAQGVWQDDVSFNILVTKNSDVSYRLGLDMVKDRPTYLYGSYLYSGEAYEKILIKGNSTYTETVPVTVRFTKKQPGVEEVVYESQTFNIPLEGKCGPEQEFVMEIDTTTGVPAGAFNFSKEGPYILEAEAFRKDNNESTKIKVSLFGDVKETRSPSMMFEYATLNYSTLWWLESETRRLMTESNDSIPEYYPLPMDGLDVRMGTHHNLSFLNTSNYTRTKAFFKDWLTMRAILNNVDRIALVLHFSDMDLIKENVSGLALSPKGFLVSSLEDQYSVGHEMVHTLPYLWSATQMGTECGRDYHNTNETIAHGHRLAGGAPGTILKNQHHYMGASVGGFQWTTQCTYRHLIKPLGNVPDPEVILVHGFLTRDGSRGSLSTIYQLNSTLDPEAEGNWSIILRDSSGAELSNHTFEPVWLDPDTFELTDETAFFLRVPALSGVNQIDLYGPSGLLDSKVYNEKPQVTILSPAYGSTVVGNMSEIKWQGTDADGDELLYTVLYSTDGVRWVDHAYERDITELTIPLANVTHHYVKVIANDGTQSSEAVVEFDSRETAPVKDVVIDWDGYEEEEGFCCLPGMLLAFLIGGAFLRKG